MAPNKNKKTANTKRKDFAQKYAFWIVFGVILLAAITIVALKLFLPKNSENPEPVAPSNIESDVSSAMDNSDITESIETVTPEEPEETTDNTTTDKTPAQYEGTNPNTLSKLTGNITYTGYINDSYTVRINIDQSIGDTGTCEITMSPSTGSPYRKSVRTKGEPHSSTCDGFDIGVGQLKRGETYDVTILISAEDKTMTLRDKVTIPAQNTSEESAEE